MELDAMRLASALFGGQDSLATTSQLLSAGVTEGVIRQRVRSGEWERPAQGVVALSGVSWSWRRRARRALLATGLESALAASSAARVHGFDGYNDDERVVVTAPDGAVLRRREDWSTVRSTRLRRQDCVVVDGLWCVMRPVALVQVAAADGVDAAGRALDSMLRRGDSPEWIRSAAERWKGHGVAGPSTVLALLDQRVDGRLPRSWFQRLAKRALQARGFRMVDEHPVHAPDGRLIAELDLALPELQIGVECQSWSWHATPTARAADAARKRRVRLLGWELVEVWWNDLHRLDDVVAELLLLVDRRVSGRGRGWR
jgi:hypothetical protein